MQQIRGRTNDRIHNMIFPSSSVFPFSPSSPPPLPLPPSLPPFSLPSSLSLSPSHLAICCRRESRALLSFGDELAGEGPEFRVKKSSHSRRAAKMAERERKARKRKEEFGKVTR